MYIRPNMSEEDIQNIQPESTQVFESEQTQVSLSEIFSQVESKPIEVKILKQLRYLPLVFMIKTKYGQVQKVSLSHRDMLDCSNYVSNSGLTFNGCFEFRDNELREVRGIYFVPFSAKFSLEFRGKITRNLNEMKEFILRSLDILNFTTNLKNAKTLIAYNNYSFSVFDRFMKAKLYQFDSYGEQGHLEIFAIPQPKYADVLEFRFWNEIQIYNHELKFDKKVLAYEPYVRPGTAMIIFTMDQTEMNISSPDHGDMTLILDAKKFYILVHPRPITNRVD